MGRDMADEPRIEHLAMDREQRRLELEVLEANALHHESQTEVSAGRAALEIDGVSTGPMLRERVSRLADYHGSITHLRADIDQELSDYRPAEPEIHTEIHTASTVAIAELSAALELIWHARTMKDARKGDQIRPAGSDMPNGTAVTDRLLPPTDDASDRGTWHVVSAGNGKWAHLKDHVVQPGEVWLCLDGGAPQSLNPDFPIEILLTRAEIAAIDALGWDNREELRS